MSHHEKTDKQVVVTQFICFFLCSVIALTSNLFDEESREIIFKFVHAFTPLIRSGTNLNK